MGRTAAGVLGIHMIATQGNPTRIGTLTRDGNGATALLFDEPYLRDPERPILSLAWYDPTSDGATRAHLVDRTDKIGLHGNAPPWFSGLLPEGALRSLVLSEMGPGNHDQFDLLTRLGADLPGAVLLAPETDIPHSAGPLYLERVQGLQVSRPEGMVKFSLAGVQLKFSALANRARLSVPAQAGTGRCIVKLSTEHYPQLPEAEFAAMSLCGLLGVNTASCRLAATEEIDGIPEEYLKHGPSALVVDRFDRTDNGGRIHIEDAAQILGAIGDRKYTMATTETILNMIKRFSTDARSDLIEGIRRVVADILVGNGDSHLKNWSFIFPAAGEIRLSPAYDIVPTVLYEPRDTLALSFVNTNNFETVSLKKFRRVARFLKLDPEWIDSEVRQIIHRALALWPDAATRLLPPARSRALLARLADLPLVKQACS